MVEAWRGRNFLDAGHVNETQGKRAAMHNLVSGQQKWCCLMLRPVLESLLKQLQYLGIESDANSIHKYYIKPRYLQTPTMLPHSMLPYVFP
jgi:hypothetical protein